MIWLLRAAEETLGHPPETHSADPHYGMHPAWFALIFGILSGTSLPIGSGLGIVLSPVSEKVCALMMAFGAGALLFAVTVELYGHALREVAVGRLGLLEMFTTIFGALAGAAFYLTINKWLEEYLITNDTPQGEEEEKDVERPGIADKPDRLRKPRQTVTGESFQRALVDQAKKQEEKETEKKDTEKLETVEEGEKKETQASPREKGSAKSSRAKELWAKARQAKVIIRTMTIMKSDDMQKFRAREIALRAMHSPEEIQHKKSVAFALFLGLLVDGVPEGVLMGFLSAEGHLTPVLIISLFVANFPEAFSSASLLIQANMSAGWIIGMWTGLCLLVGCLAGASCALLLFMFPEFGQGGLHDSNLPMSVLLGIALVEGITGGAMIACISSVMLPEAFERAGKSGPFYSQSGFLCTSGFLLSVALKALFG